MYFVTGAAGFIGFNVCRRLLACGQKVIGLDSINSSYDPMVKYTRLHALQGKSGFRFIEGTIHECIALPPSELMEGKINIVIHLAAQAGVGESMEEPFKCVESNFTGFAHMLEFCRHLKVQHLVYASTSAVYGEHNPLPWSTDQPVDKPISLYAASKKANELMAHCYSNAYRFNTTGLRFFTVYGPYGRPDMAIFKFTRALYRNEPIVLYNNGDMSRDFTYVDDIVDGILAAAHCFGPDKLYRVYNIGSGQATNLLDLVKMLEKLTGKKAKVKFGLKPVSDLQHSLADVQPMRDDFQWEPKVSIEQGLANFVQWYSDFRQQPGNDERY
jgi:UDP-glucuronate 4-epimerase